MAERVAQLAVATVELVCAGAQHGGPGGNRPVEPGVGIVDIKHGSESRAAAERIRGDGADLLFMLGVFVGEIEGAAIDPQCRVTNLPLMLEAFQFLGREGGLVERDRLGAAPNAKIGRDDSFGRAHTVSPTCNPVGWL